MISRKVLFAIVFLSSFVTKSYGEDGDEDASWSDDDGVLFTSGLDFGVDDGNNADVADIARIYHDLQFIQDEIDNDGWNHANMVYEHGSYSQSVAKVRELGS